MATKGVHPMHEQRQLHHTLQKLHDELENTQTVDERSRELMQDLRGHIQQVLQNPSEHEPAHYHSLRSRLEATLEHVEDQHPQLTLAIGQVLNNLAAIGI
jgi:ElaB/YqjD/DUF883 family membrane-anchored ribosome-binding protein